MVKHNIKATNTELTPAIRAYIEEKLTALEKLIDSSDTSVHAAVEVGKTTTSQHSGDVFRAEVNLHVAGANLRAEATRDDLYAAIDEVKDELMRSLRRRKTRRTKLVRRGARSIKNALRRWYPK